MDTQPNCHICGSEEPKMFCKIHTYNLGDACHLDNHTLGDAVSLGSKSTVNARLKKLNEILEELKSSLSFEMYGCNLIEYTKSINKWKSQADKLNEQLELDLKSNDLTNLKSYEDSLHDDIKSIKHHIMYLIYTDFLREKSIQAQRSPSSAAAPKQVNKPDGSTKDSSEKISKTKIETSSKTIETNQEGNSSITPAEPEEEDKQLTMSDDEFQKLAKAYGVEKNGNYCLDATRDFGKNFITACDHKRMPNLKNKFTLNISDKNVEETKDFFENIIALEFDKLGMSSNNTSILNSTGYLGGIEKRMKAKVKDLVSAYQIRFNSNEFSKFLYKFRDIKTVIFDRCKIDTPDLKLIDGEYKIEILDFNISGHSSLSNWEETDRLNKFKSIIEAISKCSLKDSLKQINIMNCDIYFDTAQSILYSYGLGAIELRNDIRIQF